MAATGWDGYVQSLKAGGNIEKAAVVGLNGQVWASSEGYNVTPVEALAIIKGFDCKDSVCASGIKCCGQKFMFIQSDDKQMQGKKGNSGVTIAKAKTCVIIGEYGDGIQPGNARSAVEGITEHLRDAGF